jgi:predicted nucleic acid-binding protein
MTYALDTNIISYFVQGSPHISLRLREALARGDSFVIPPVAYYEIRRGFKHRAAPAKERAFAGICSAYPVGAMGIAAWELAAGIYADLRNAGRAVEDADILIAAFCIENGHTLVTNNTKHFEGISELRLANWAE